MVKCIPNTRIKEYQSFILKSTKVGTHLGMEEGSELVVTGANGQPDKHSLEMCVVSTDSACNPAFPTHCIYENVEYRFRVEQPEAGYLRIVDSDSGKRVSVVQDWDSASPLSFLREEAHWGLRVAQIQPDGSYSVFQADEMGQPISFVRSVQDHAGQWFTIESP
ncbi:hypothetical protein BGZ75_000313 [Mortierella antarctica]|nr:hypothetical protein BGZ75_000313 [Mortierella antarctica]